MSRKRSTCPPRKKRLACWRVLDERLVYSAGPWFNLVRQRVELPDGRVIPDYHEIRFPEYVTIVARTPERRFLMLRKYNHGFRKVCFIFPGGMRHEHETPRQAAARELLEETGCKAGRWTCLGHFTPHSNYGCGRSHLYLAEDCRPVAAPASGDLEEIEVHALPARQAYECMRRGQNPSLSCMAAFLLAREHLRSRAGRAQ